MRTIKTILASAAAASLAATPIVAQAQERVEAPVAADTEELRGAPPISLIGYIAGIALTVIILIAVLDDDEDEDLPTSP